MSGSLTAEQAIERLMRQPGAFGTRDKLAELAKQVDANSPGHLTVLYSGNVVDKLPTEDIAVGLDASVRDLRIINNSPAAKFLTSDEFKTFAARLDGVLLRDFDKKGYSSPTTDWLYHPTDGPWADVSKRFADGARGDVRAIVPNASPDRVFASSELPSILANEQVTSLEGLSRPRLAELHARDSRAAFELVAAQSHANMSDIRLGIYVDGTVVRDEKEKSQVDGRSYFRNGQAQGHAPNITSSARDLGAIMGPPSERTQAGYARVQAWRTEAMPDADLRIPSVETGAVRSVGRAMGVAAAGVEIGSAAHDYARLRGQGNLTAAQASVGRSVSTGAGAWMGFEAGAFAGASGGPLGALGVGALGAVVGGLAGDKIADKIQERQIYTQRGSDLNTWQANPAHPEQGWTRTLPALPTAPQGQRFDAPPALADELNYKAVSKATELGMGSASARNPFVLPASREDTFSAYGGDWTRNAVSGGWQRQINYDRPGLGHTESASPQRAEQLDAQSQQIAIDNAAHSPAALAATYMALYNQNDWQRHGKVPSAVENTMARPERVLASDGHTYGRQANGEWIHNEFPWATRAKGNLPAELDLALEAQRSRVQQLLSHTAPSGREIPTLETVKVTPTVEQQAEIGKAVASPPASVDPTPSPLPDRMSDAGHPANDEFQRILGELHQAEAARGIPHGKHSEQVAAALLVQAEQKGERIASVRIVDNGHIDGFAEFQDRSGPGVVRVAADKALSMSVEQHSQQWEQSRLPRHDDISALSPDDQAMFARIRQGVPGHVGDDHVMRALYDAKKADMASPDRIGQVMMAGDTICIAGTVPGFRSMTDVAQNAPPLKETAEQLQSFNQQREHQLAMEQQRNQDGPGGRAGPSFG
ncbi:XVIPCD domain-containing protein [Stenotrophomonas sp. YAU14A_MKIMI4_1]|uniref:XVIPCD domain-containing protein n=1 Tax=Stenotrophomonas sp. YAU14A_MKIMI4_1 TaxID=2072408 RepID=UPI00131EE043|nr:XVIPCD domain-containing protein [Stenotrophomonas sp. YAU14A_MKIMI4_1]